MREILHNADWKVRVREESVIPRASNDLATAEEGRTYSVTMTIVDAAEWDRKAHNSRNPAITRDGK